LCIAWCDSFWSCSDKDAFYICNMTMMLLT
jgi:hypothetical protein